MNLLPQQFVSLPHMVLSKDKPKWLPYTVNEYSIYELIAMHSLCIYNMCLHHMNYLNSMWVYKIWTYYPYDLRVYHMNLLYTICEYIIYSHFPSKPLMNLRIFATLHSLMKDTNLIDSCQAHFLVQYASNIESIRQKDTGVVIDS